MERKLIFALILILSCLALQAQAKPTSIAEDPPIFRKPEYGLMMATASTGSDPNYRNKAGGKLGFYGRWQISRLADLSAELHMHLHNTYRFVPHPSPYVIGMRENLNALKLRLPVSILLLGDVPPHDVTPILGVGLYLETPIYCRRVEERDYITETQKDKENVTDDYPPTLGMQFRMGGKFNQLTLEFRFSTELFSQELPWIVKGRNTQYDSALVMGIALF